MYRYRSDNIITYTPEDLVLFKESPFACWMERLTLENPGHGISPDAGSKPKRESTRFLHNIAFRLNAQSHTANSVTWEDFVHVSQSPPVAKASARTSHAYTLHVEGGDVFVVDQKIDEPLRRARTIEAMHRGTKFIINGQLAIGPLSAACDLLIRSPGVSELGDYFYMPCSTHPDAMVHAKLRLCFAADLLHDLQGKLPPQFLLMLDCGGLLSQQTEDHIYHYRAVKHRFMTAQLSFRKHRMPDPVDSSHFGRWSACANDLIKRRAVSSEYQGQQNAAGDSGNVETLHSLNDQMALQSDLDQCRDATGNVAQAT
jgi:hypothetical protein